MSPCKMGITLLSQGGMPSPCHVLLVKIKSQALSAPRRAALPRVWEPLGSPYRAVILLPGAKCVLLTPKGPTSFTPLMHPPNSRTSRKSGPSSNEILRMHFLSVRQPLTREASHLPPTHTTCDSGTGGGCQPRAFLLGKGKEENTESCCCSAAFLESAQTCWGVLRDTPRSGRHSLQSHGHPESAQTCWGCSVTPRGPGVLPRGPRLCLWVSLPFSWEVVCACCWVLSPARFLLGECWVPNSLVSFVLSAPTFPSKLVSLLK